MDRKLENQTTKRWDVLGLGAVAVDDILQVDAYPSLDSKTPVISRERQAGGLAGTALVAVVRLGGKAAFLGVLGEDELSAFTFQEFGREGVDCSLISRDQTARPIYSTVIIEKKTGLRTIFFDHSGIIQPPVETLSREIISQCSVLFVDYTAANSAVLAGQMANMLGIPVVADIERGTSEELEPLLNVADHLVIGVQMGKQLSGKSNPGEMVKELIKGDYLAVVVTAGDRGCWFAEPGKTVRHIPALEVVAIDTVGCGDVFHGAYALAIARGFDVTFSAKFANITAGLKTRMPGGRRGIPGWDEVISYL